MVRCPEDETFSRVQAMIERRAEMVTYLDPAQLLRPEDIAGMLDQEDAVGRLTAANLQRLLIPTAATFHAKLSDVLSHMEDLIPDLTFRIFPRADHLFFATRGSVSDRVTLVTIKPQKIKRGMQEEKICETILFCETGKEHLRKVASGKAPIQYKDVPYRDNTPSHANIINFPASFFYLTGFVMDGDGQIIRMLSWDTSSSSPATEYLFGRSSFSARILSTTFYRYGALNLYRDGRQNDFVLLDDGCMHRSVDGERYPLTIEQEVDQILARLPLKEELSVLDREFPTGEQSVEERPEDTLIMEGKFSVVAESNVGSN